MGVRGEVFSTKVALPNRTYFFNVKENRMGDLYLNIVESKNRETGGFDRQSVILFADDLQEFLKGFDESLRVLEKSVRNKKKGGSEKRVLRGDTETQRPQRENKKDDRGFRKDKDFKKDRDFKKDKEYKKDKGFNKDKKIVVKKRKS
ncbi:MAG: DUF3276 family protein [Treponema sp.]|jgi:hypothetical protein|nr:DUF3276 family protein [Treponema sp.]